MKLFGMELTDVVWVVFANAIYICGIFYGARDGKALTFLHTIGRKLPSILYEGLINCIQCMSTIHGTYFLMVVLVYNSNQVPIIGGVFKSWWDLLLIPVYTLALSFVTLTLNLIYEIVLQIKIRID